MCAPSWKRCCTTWQRVYVACEVCILFVLGCFLLRVLTFSGTGVFVLFLSWLSVHFILSACACVLCGLKAMHDLQKHWTYVVVMLSASTPY